jgi:signal transduction histidine kinase
VRQLVLIVLDNAIKFSHDGGKIEVGVRVHAGVAAVIVQDEGVGIASADVPRVFDRFYRAESARGATVGAGLGLAIAKWIADVHGAHITIEPGPERGTRVSVCFPVATLAQP